MPVLMVLVLRALALGAKFALALVIARTLGYAAVAEYGLAVAAAVIGSKVLGLGFSAEINRKLASAPGTAILAVTRLAWIHLASYLLLAIAATWLWCAGVAQSWAVPASLTALTIAVVVTDHQAFEINSYLYSLHRRQIASWLMFARTGLWAVAAIGGLMSGAITGMAGVLVLWATGNLLVIVCGWWRFGVVRSQVSPDEGHAAFLWPAALWHVWQRGAGYYLAAIMLSATQYAERLIGAWIMSAGEVGRYVFLWAIANAVQTLAHASLATTAGPALARAAHAAPLQVAALLKRQTLAAFGTSLVTALALWCLLDLVLALAGRSSTDMEADRFVFGILLASFVVRAMTDIQWAAVIALEMRGCTLLGLTALACAGMPLASILIGANGMAGAALAHGCVSLMIAGWLAWSLRQRLDPDPPGMGQQQC